jgi:hypothetical protein
MRMTWRISIDLKPLNLILSFLVVICAGLSLNTTASADQSFNPEEVVYKYEFGNSLSISATIPQPQDIKNLTIVIEPEDQQSRQVQVLINSNQKVDATYDLRTNALDPFSRVYFWFEAELSDGSILTSPSYWFDYIDNRFEWKSNSTSLFEIFWVNGDAGYGQILQRVARSGLERATQLLPVVPEIPINIYVYPDEVSLKSVLTPDSHTWVNGHTYLSANRILVADAPPLDNVTDIERTIPHELMHLLQYQVMGNNYGHAPLWLTEGLSAQTELYANTDYERVLSQAIENKSLRPISELCLGISKESSLAIIDYAQSSSYIDFIQQNYGNQVFLKMLQDSATGMDCDKTVSTSLGIPLQQLETNWNNAHSGEKPTLSPSQISTILWVAIPAVLLLAGVIVLILRQKAHQQDQES